MDVNGLFERKGDAALVQYFRDCVDSGAAFDLENLLLDTVAEGEIRRNDSAPFKVDAKPVPTADGIPAEVLGAEMSALNLGTSTTPSTSAGSAEITQKIDLKSEQSQSPDAGVLGTVLPLPKTRLGRTTSIHSAAEALLELLSSFKDPVIPYSLYYRCVQEGYLSFAAAKQLVTAEQLPKVFSTVLLRPVQPSLASIIPASVNAGVATAPTAKRTSSLPLSIGQRLDSITGGTGGATSGGSISNESKQRMFLMHFLTEGNDF
ncbi:hypothetical protein HDU96_001678 [Phlyctochytrium bullatum]|nr:hypothetical protein HDU96_001678 [Phlyctochytrium bullatum]